MRKTYKDKTETKSQRNGTPLKLLIDHNRLKKCGLKKTLPDMEQLTI